MVGPRVFTLDEANEMLPVIEQAFEEIDELREKLRLAKVKLNALEMIWGSSLHIGDCPDREEARTLVSDLEESEKAISSIVQRMAEAGTIVKDVHTALVDLYHVHEGQLVFLCWKRGEDEIISWHHVDTGYADRQTL